MAAALAREFSAAAGREDRALCAETRCCRCPTVIPGPR
jgi:hypothetical protein